MSLEITAIIATLFWEANAPTCAKELSGWSPVIILKNGWITKVLFYEWLLHFRKFAMYSKAESVLLVLYNYSSHISLCLWDSCIINYTSLFTCAAICRPEFFQAFNRGCDIYLKTHEHDRISHFELA